MEAQKTVLKTQDLSIGYRGKQHPLVVYENINLDFCEGRLVSLVGANGIGKSTLLRTLAALQNPLSGNVSLFDKNIGDYKALELASKISMVLTEKLPPGNLTVFELVALGRQPYTNWIGKLSGDDLQKIRHALEVTQTLHLSDKKHYEISDGQLQKVMIARALAQDTPIIILDEPTTHLDLQHKVSLFILLKKLASESGKCILFSTHDIDLAIEMSDEMILMSNGKVIYGKPGELISANAFDDLFPDKNISFDKQKVKFVFRDKPF
jgi:iron complex transport system ATP-binding protein